MFQDILKNAMEQGNVTKTSKTYRITETILDLLDRAQAYEIGKRGETITEVEFINEFLEEAIKKIYPDLKPRV